VHLKESDALVGVGFLQMPTARPRIIPLDTLVSLPPSHLPIEPTKTGSDDPVGSNDRCVAEFGNLSLVLVGEQLSQLLCFSLATLMKILSSMFGRTLDVHQIGAKPLGSCIWCL
jgi:hypothetical protein